LRGCGAHEQSSLIWHKNLLQEQDERSIRLADERAVSDLHADVPALSSRMAMAAKTARREQHDLTGKSEHGVNRIVG
jgi:hypothetical protein